MKHFDDIRPYTNDEIHGVLLQLVQDPMFVGLIGKLYPQPGEKELIIQNLQNFHTIEDLQSKFIIPFLEKIEKSSTKGLSYSTMDQFHPEESYLFISNHRDIILDSAFLNAIMHLHGFRKTEIAIGDNLLAYEWIEKLVRINRSFIVKRNLGLREQLAESKKLSAYIRYAISEKGESAWIAQREGRTKDGNDQTQMALLKMLNMSNTKTLIEGFKEINIVPMAISYEIEPCGISKVEELLNRKHDPDFKKSQQDDMRSMANGVMLPKGRIHYAFGNPLNLRIEELMTGKKNNEAIQAITDYIDRRIYFNYKLWPNNYVAYDLLNKTARYAQKYTSEDKQAFISMINKEVASLAFDAEEATQTYLNMYANPVLNFEKHFPS
ncbi:MAG: 1-acyl-sn-glycerol-3-phosphate acyltransferase [Prolixibacteraceae bacterium]